MCNLSHVENSIFNQSNNFEYWAEAFHRAVNPFSVDTDSRENFDADLHSYSLGDAVYVLCSGKSAINARRNTQHIAAAEKHSFHLVMRRSGNGRIVQGGREAYHSAGEFVLIDTKEEIIAEMDNLNFSFVSFPDELIRAWIPNPEDCVAQVLVGNKGWGAVLMNYFLTLELDTIKVMTQTQHTQMLEHILSIYSFALKEVGIITQQDPYISEHTRTERYGLMYNWMAEHYMDSELTAEYMASQFHVSIREVHRQFSLSSNGSTFLETLRDMRMKAAVRMLKNKNFAKLPISEIGIRAGFHESSYFGKVFRTMTGSSPKSYAKLHQ